MAIFGSFAEFSPADALHAVGLRNGVFVALASSGKKFEIYLRAGCVVGLCRDGAETKDLLGLHDSIAELIASQAGEFEFRRLPAARLEGAFEVPLERLVVSALTVASDVRSASPALPSPETVLEAVSEPAVPLPDDLQLFWSRSRDCLRVGASAQHLSEQFGLSLPRVQWCLYRLRLAGIVTARRLTALPGSFSPSSAPAKSQGLLASTQPARPARPVLRRLLDGIAGLLRFA